MRVCIIVLDGLGIGALPDAGDFGDIGAHTIGNIYKTRGHLAIPNLYQMGIGNIENAELPSVSAPTAAYGRMAARTKAKDTTSGHWEMMGLVMDPPFKTLTQFPEEMLETWLTRGGRPPKWLGNCPASGTAIIDQLGEAHMATGAPIVYTSADSVFQVAAHESIIPLQELYGLCEIARELLVGDLNIGRVIARPFIGEVGAFQRTPNRKDYAVPPPAPTVLDMLAQKGQTTLGIGKIHDIFCGQGVAASMSTKNNQEGIAATIEALQHDTDHAVIFTNLVDFDMHYGHRNDPEGFAQALEAFDAKLPDILAALHPTDRLIITADHGCDPTTAHTDHTREYVPVLVYGNDVKGTSLGTLPSFGYVGELVGELLGI